MWWHYFIFLEAVGLGQWGQGHWYGELALSLTTLPHSHFLFLPGA